MSGDSVSRSKIIDVLLASPVFGKLDRAVIDALADVLKLRQVPGGHNVIREREPSNEMLFLISGGLRVSRRDAQGKLMLYNEIRPGMSFGESGLILRQPRAADVTAVRDSVLAVLDRNDFEALLNRFPLPINQVVVRAVYNYLRHSEEFAERRHAQSFVVIPLHENSGAGEVAANLVAAFSKMGRAHLLDAPRDHLTTKSGMSPLRQSVQDIATYQDALEEGSDFLVYEAEVGATEWSLRAFRQSDQVIFVAREGSPGVIGELERQLRAQPDFSMKRSHLTILHPETAELPGNLSAWNEGRTFERVYPLRSKRTGDFARLARFLTGKAVGVVLGGGGAKGFAHVGVLRAMEEMGIAVDLIGGNSMGALIAAQFACGVSLDDIVSRTREFASGGERPAIPLISIVSGKRVSRDLQRMFGDQACDGQWIPFFAAACNLTKGRTTVQDSGPIWRAVLASNSPAGLFPPVLLNGDMLVDGAILENVPVDAMRMRLGTPLERRRGNGTIIAIDVDVQEAMAVDPSLTRLSAWSTLKAYFSPKAHPSPTIADILYRAGHIGGLNQRSRTIAQADYYLEPPVADFSMMSYRKADEIADVGYHYAMKSFKQWKLQA
jgi:predicted acylesterase/phospholipase RssA/CRP-like cAMP-binding protein